jgi:TRAP-type uncharacterized transport system fused permease subunit
MESGLAAVKLGATGYLVPYLFVFAPALLLIGGGLEIALAVATGLIGVSCLAASLHGYFIAPAAWWQRLVLFATAIALLLPGVVATLIGGVLLALILASQLGARRAEPDAL